MGEGFPVLMHKDALKYDGIVTCQHIEQLAHGDDADFLLPFYKPARTEIRDCGMPGERGYHDWLEVTLRQRTLTILFTEKFQFEPGKPITLETFEGWQTRVIAVPHCEAELVELGFVWRFDISVEDE